MSSAQDRRGLNEAIFREVNERLEELGRSFAEPDSLLNFVCECNDPRCDERIELTLTEYEDVRAQPTTFAVRPGHVDASVEVVLARHDRFAVVDKRERETAARARALDPRG